MMKFFRHNTNCFQSSWYLVFFLFLAVVIVIDNTTNGFQQRQQPRRSSFRSNRCHPSLLQLSTVATTLSSNDNDNDSSPPTTTNTDSCADDNLITIPIFPVRKYVRLPTDTTELNLFEPRYLQMSRYILDQNFGIFGAMYISNKPQLVKGSNSNDGRNTNPIVPILEIGDSGVVCYVEKSSEGMVPTVRDDPLSELRPRIKLESVAIGRFQIQKIISDGSNPVNNEEDPNAPLPFILVEASWIHDKQITNDDDIQKLNELKKTINTAMLESDSTTDVRPLLQWQEVAKMLEKVTTTQSDEKTGRSTTDLEDEIFSFAAATLLLSAKPSGRSPSEMTQLLQSQSTIERLEYIQNYIKKKEKKGWFSSFF